MIGPMPAAACMTDAPKRAYRDAVVIPGRCALREELVVEFARSELLRVPTILS